MKSYNLGETDISTEILTTSSGEGIEIYKYHFLFSEWKKPCSFDTYGGKAILNYNGEALFAELVVLRLFEQQGYKGVWVDTYRNKFWQRLPEISFPVVIDNKLQGIYDRIYKTKGGKKSGCFDVIAYKGDQFIFAELKRSKKDSIRPTQVEWLQAGLTLGIDKFCYLICEWDLV
jgi:hypothetical protein